ncbi:FtsX-like permease family protein [Chitinibacter bivalviorum]|uniref:FtsX-like permease family protein n=1 Tax=Chitinibacter bivalviorum TaxID=2739434 RepID=A0A7H9BHX4_9NEIS|nr:FtsX-like permease family protein [Chitinibacter bivalviorum]QLG88323.1 FtsX-like permease family protein [Chitinibacter bivalviorum]
MTAPSLMPSRTRWALDWKLFRRSMSAGEYKTLLLALTIAIASLTAVGMLTERVERLLLGQANQLQAADAVLIADHAIAPKYAQLAQQDGLRLASSATFPSMVSAGEQTSLASVKAVSATYPLRGQLTVLAPDVAQTPRAGEALIDQRLQAVLRLKVGDDISLGQLKLKVRGIIDREPDAAFDFSSLQARVLMNEADLARSGLLGFGSRVKYRLMVAGDEASLARWQQAVKPQLARGESLENVRDSRPELKEAIDRAERFLRLAALLAGVLAAVAIVLAARRFALRHFDTVALLRTLGASQAMVRRLLLSQLLLLLGFAAVMGGALAWLAQLILVFAIADQLPAALPAASLAPWLWASGLGLVLLLGSAGPVLLTLAKTSPLRVLRRELVPSAHWLWQYGITILAMAGILIQISQDIKLAAIVGGGIVLALLLVAALGWAILKLLQRLFPRGAAKIALRQMLRQPGLVLAQLAALMLGLCGLWLLTVVQQDLLAAWRNQVPANAPNHFAVNIQPEQEAQFAQLFTRAGLAEPKILPMIRGRWTLHNQVAVNPRAFTEERAQRLAEREFNLSWGDDERSDNQRVEGPALRVDQPGWSVEIELAKQLGIKLGDVLTFDIAGTAVSAPVVNFRKVNWGSFRANFFVIGSEYMMQGQPSSLISSFYLPPSAKQLVPELVHALPNVTVIDVGQVLAQVESVISLASAALRLVFVMCLLAGLTVLLAALDTNEAERRYEAALMRALGASTRKIAQIWWLESLLLGAVAGLLAGTVAAVGAWYVAQTLFKLPWLINWSLPFYSALAGMLLAAVTVGRRLWRLSKTSPLQILQ